MKLPRIPLRRQKLPKVMGKALGFGEGAESQVLLLSGQPQSRAVSMAGQWQGHMDQWAHFSGWYELPGSQEPSPFCLQLLDLQAHFA